jgi:hypothetical protein
MLRQQFADQMKIAMKARDADRLSVLRFVWSEIKNKEIDAKHELDDNEVVDILRREVKRRTESIEQYKQGGRMDIVDKEKSELVVINSFLPQLMSKAQVEEIVKNVLSTLEDRDFGHVMRAVMPEVKGKADGTLVSEVVKSLL